MTSAPTVAFISFRLGGSDGVSVETAKWASALGHLGFRSRRIAGEIVAPRHKDTVIPELAMDAEIEPDLGSLETAIEGVDLVVVENLLSLPLNLPAARTVAKVVAGHPRVILHHHDLPWQRRQHEHVREVPPDLPETVHVVINDRSRRELAERGITATTIRNHFDLDPTPGDRVATRRALGMRDEDLLLLHPVRAIPRKNVPAALELAAAVTDRLPGRRVVYWLPGPAEDGYEHELRHLLDGSPVPVLRDPAPSMTDAYAACDLVVFPSSWEGFGNPVVESIAHRRPLAVSRYPVLAELEALGMRFLAVDQPESVAAVLAGARDPEPDLRRNAETARRHLDLSALPGRLHRLLESAGWA